MVGGNQNEGLLVCGGIIQGFPNSRIKQQGLRMQTFSDWHGRPVNLAALDQEKKGLLGLLLVRIRRAACVISAAKVQAEVW
jgi:hypothetical protein